MDDVEDLAAVIEQWLQGNTDRAVVATQCHEVIDQYYNPHYQIKVVRAAVLNQALVIDRLSRD